MCLKQCSKCKESKEYSEFNKRASSLDGLNNICKSCISIRRKELKVNTKFRIKTELHKIVLVENKILKQEGLSQCHNPNCRAEVPLNKSNHYCKDCEKLNREKDKEKVLAQKKAYRDRNKEKQKAYNESRKELMKDYWATRYIKNKDKIREQQRLNYLKKKELNAK